jgi:hypothetical protein
MSEEKVLDYRTTEIGRQNWEVCARMLVHDLIDESENNPGVAKILKHYRIRYLHPGSYTMALPRLKLLESKCQKKKVAKLKKI